MSHQGQDVSFESGALELELLEELERQSASELSKLRRHQRVALRATVRVAPASSSQRHRFEGEGTTVDLSEGGSCAIFSDPLRVGDVYRLEIDAPNLDLPPVFARCLRCRLLREDAFEAGFQFLSPIQLDSAEQAPDDLLG